MRPLPILRHDYYGFPLPSAILRGQRSWAWVLLYRYAKSILERNAAGIDAACCQIDLQVEQRISAARKVLKVRDA